MKLTCPNLKCKYSWEYKGKNGKKFYATCPRCLYKVKIQEEKNARE